MIKQTVRLGEAPLVGRPVSRPIEGRVGGGGRVGLGWGGARGAQDGGGE